MPLSSVRAKVAPKLKTRVLSKRVVAKKDETNAPSAIKGLRGFRSLSGTFSWNVDKGVSQQDAAFASRAKMLPGLNARLIRINPAENSDSYYVLQGLEDPRVPAKSAKRCYAYQRWGRTGTGGVCRLQGPMQQSKVEAHLFKVFKAKTGSPWGSLKPGEKALSGKYWLANPSTDCLDPCAVWQYYVGDGVDGKHKGWHPYDAEGVAQVEALYAEHQANRGSTNPTSKRFVDSGKFTYCIDFDTLSQSNIATGKTRSIRRVHSTSKSQASSPIVLARPVTAKAHTSSVHRSGSESLVATGLSACESFHRPDSLETIPATASQIEATMQASAQTPPAHACAFAFGKKRSLSSMCAASKKTRTGATSKKRSFADMLAGSTGTLEKLQTTDNLPIVPSKKRQCRQDTRPCVPNSLADMQQLVLSGKVKQLSHPELRSFLHEHGVVATGRKDDLLDRVREVTVSTFP